MGSIADEYNKKARERRAATCRHFNGLVHKECDIGILYDTVKDESVKPFRFSCLNSDCLIICESKSLYSTEELDNQDKERKESFIRVQNARKAIVKTSNGKRNIHGVIDCPNCNGKLSYSIAGNGHIWGVCSTENCARWME